MRFSPSAWPSSTAVEGERKWTWVSAQTHPCAREIGVFGDFQVKLALFRPDVEPLPQRSEFKSLGSLHVDFAYRQLHLELAVHVGERFRAYADIRAIILKPAAIDLAAMPIGRDVPPLAGAERHPRRHRAGR